MMKKRVLSFLLAVVLLLSLLPTGAIQGTVNAAETVAYAVEGGNIYFDPATETITDCDTTVTSAVIPAEINGVPVTYIGFCAFLDCTDMTSVTIPDSVTSIGITAFGWCDSLTSVTIGDSVTTIGDDAFTWCSGLTSVTIPNSVTYIGGGAFQFCTNLTSVTISDSMTTIDGYAFSYCNSLTSVTIPNSVTSVGNHAFYDCSALTSVMVLNPNCTIYDFEDTLGVPGTTVIYGYSGSTAESYAEKYGYSFFPLGTEPSKTKTVYPVEGGNIYFDKSTETIIGCDLSITSAEIPAEIDGTAVTYIDVLAFETCHELASVTIPDSVISIGDLAFLDCGLKSVSIGNGVTSIGIGAFDLCTGLSSVTIPSSATKIGESAFQDCYSLTSVTVLNPNCSISDGKDTLGVPGTTVIYGYSGSTAQSYANKYGYTFSSIGLGNAVTSSNASDVESATDDEISAWINSQGSATLNMGNNVEGPSISFLGKDIQLFRVGTLEVDLPGAKKLSVTREVDPEKKTIKIILGLSDEVKARLENGKDNRTQYGKEYQDIKEFFKFATGKDIANGSTAAWNKYQKLRSKLQKDVISTDGSVGVEASIKPVGYLEFSYETGKLVLKEGGVAVIADAGVTFRYQPNLIYVELAVAGQADMGITMVPDASNALGVSLSGFNGKFSLGITPAVGLGVKDKKFFGISVDAYIEGGANGSINFDVDTKAKQPATVYLEAKAYLKGKLSVLEKTFTHNFGKYYLYPKGYNGKRDVQQLMSQGLTDENIEFVPIPREYLSAPEKKATIPTDAELLMSSVYPYTAQTLTNLGDGKQMLVYVGDNGTKNDMDRTTIFYRIFDGRNWSEEQAVFESGTYMDAPVVFSRDGRTLVAWIQANQTFSVDADEEMILKSCDIYMSEYIDGAFTQPVCISGEDDGTYEHSIAISADESGDLHFYWIQNDDVILGDTGTNKILTCSIASGAWTEETVICETTNMISAIGSVHGEEEDRLCAVMSEPSATDGEYDYYLYVYNPEENEFTKAISDSLEGAQIYEDKIYYAADGEIFVLDLGTGAVEETGLANIGDIDVVSNGGTVAVVATVQDGLKNELYVSYCTGGVWTPWEQLTNYGEYIRHSSALMTEDGNIKLAVAVVTVEEDNDGTQRYGSAADLIVEGKTEFVDLYTSYIVYDEENSTPGSATAFSVMVGNSGNIDCSGYTVRLFNANGEEYVQHFSEVLVPGTEKEHTILWNTPLSALGEQVDVQIIADQGEMSTLNNRTSIKLALPDLTIDQVEIITLPCAGAKLVAQAVNQGTAAARNVTVKVYSDANMEDCVMSETIDEIKTGEAYNISFDLPESLLVVQEAYTLHALYITVETEDEERSYANNEDKIVFDTIANPHNPGSPAEENHQAPTCTVSGSYDVVSRCLDCGGILSCETVTVPATDHALVRNPKDADTHIITCENCDLSEEEPHSYTDGLCICGQVEVKEPIQETTWKIGHTLNLASDISVTLAISKSSLAGFDMDTIYVLAELDVYEGNIKTGTQTIKIPPTEQGSYYYFTLTGLTAVNMNDRIRSVLYGTKDGQVYCSVTDDYSIADYAYSQMNKTTAKESLKILCADLLHYGAKAQIVKSYRTDALADAAMTEMHKAYLSDIDAVTFHTNNLVLEDLDNASITWMGKALDLASKVTLKFIFNPASYKGDIENLTLHLSFEGVDGTIKEETLAGAELYNAGYGFYAFSVDSLLAAELRTVISAQIYEGDTPVSATLQYSADTYGNGKTGTLGDLCKALFAYSDSAKAYFTAQ